MAGRSYTQSVSAQIGHLVGVLPAVIVSKSKELEIQYNAMFQAAAQNFGRSNLQHDGEEASPRFRYAELRAAEKLEYDAHRQIKSNPLLRFVI